MIPTVLIPGTAAAFPNYRAALESAGCRAVFSLSPEGAEAWDGLLLPGGGDLEPWRYGQTNTASRGLEPARDQAEFDLLERFTAAKKPVLGICRGLQSINVFFGGTLIQDLPGHSAVSGIDRLHIVHTIPKGPGILWEPSSIVNSAHHQAVDCLGAGLEALQWAPNGTVEALCHQTLPVWAVQWHPERLAGAFLKQGAVDGRSLFQAFGALCRAL